MHSSTISLFFTLITAITATPRIKQSPDPFITPRSPPRYGPSDGAPTGPCVSKDWVNTFIAGFSDLLESTDVGAKYGLSGPYNYSLAASILDSDFHDYSDSINWLAGYPLTTINTTTCVAAQPATFTSLAAFNAGQSTQYPVKVYTLKSWLSCTWFAWHYVLVTGLGSDKPVSGINVFEVVGDGTGGWKAKGNWAEFNSGVWREEILAAEAAQGGA